MPEKTGLALGAGGARGLSHIGVIKALQNHKIHIDTLAGCSMGAVIGACFALGIPMERIEQELYVLKKKGVRKFIDIGFRRGSLLKGEKVKKYLADFFAGAEFKDTKLPFTVVATDLGTGQEVRISSGKIADAVLASASVPGIFPPVEREGKYLVDGGLSNPTPASVLEEQGTDRILAVDYMLKQERLKKKPGLVSTLMQSYEIIRTHNSQDKLNAVRTEMVILKPYIRKTFDSFKFYDIVKFVEAGEAAVEEKFDELKAMVN